MKESTNSNGPFDPDIWGQVLIIQPPFTKVVEWVTHMAGHKNMVLCLEKACKAVNYTFCAIIPALGPPAGRTITYKLGIFWAKLGEIFLFEKSICGLCGPFGSQ